MVTLFFHPGPIVSWDDAKNCDTEKFGRFHQGLMSRGIYFPPAQFEAAFLSLAHTAQDVESTVDAARDVLSEL
jgi:glutamate-1-semialdehyde 2,1-aminomutase